MEPDDDCKGINELAALELWRGFEDGFQQLLERDEAAGVPRPWEDTEINGPSSDLMEGLSRSLC